MAEGTPGRNFLGQRIRPRRLTRAERERVIQAVEHAMNTGIHHEVRVFWHDHGIWASPVRVDEKTQINEREDHSR